MAKQRVKKRSLSVGWLTRHLHGADEETRTLELEKGLSQYDTYTSINDIPFKLFRRLHVDKNLDVLVRSGERPAEDFLQALRTKILDEFSVRTNGQKTGEYIELVKTMQLLRSKIARAMELFKVAQARMTDNIAQALREAAFDRKYTDKTLKGDLVYVETKINSWRVMLTMKQKDYDERFGNKETAKEISHEYYFNLMAEIRKAEAPAMIPDDILTSEFCVYLDRLREHYKRLEKEITDGRR
jgi:hypothetical protein